MFAQKGYSILEDLVDDSGREYLLSRLDHYESNPGKFSEDLQFEYESGDSDRVRKMRKLAWVDPDPWSLLWLNTPIQNFLAQNFDQELRVAFCAAFLKPAEVGSRTPYHQDQALWSQALPGAVSCWVALDRADEENGCLVFCPGSQLDGEVPHKEPYGGGHPEVVGSVLDAADKHPVPLDAGSGVIWDRYTIHGSAENKSTRPRRSVVTVFAPSELLSSEDPIAWSPLSGASL